MVKLARYLTALGVGLSASAIVGWLLLRENRRQRRAPELTVRSKRIDEHPDAPPEIVLPPEALEEASSAMSESGDVTPADDLTQIHDIGPRFAAALASIGITRFEQLAAEDPDQLATRMAPYVSVRASRIRERDWIGQARSLMASRSV